MSGDVFVLCWERVPVVGQCSTSVRGLERHISMQKHCVVFQFWFQHLRLAWVYCRRDCTAANKNEAFEERNEAASGPRVGTVDDWLADCSPENPGVKLVKTEGAVRRRFGKLSVAAPSFKEPYKPRPLEAEGEPVGPEDLFFSWNVDDPTNM